MTGEGKALVFAGAGISAPLPSALPVFGPIRRAIALDLDLDTDLPLNDVLADLAPETILELLQRAGAPINELIGSLFSGGQPNAIHAALAQLICLGATVWTPNVDELIEHADTSGLVMTVRYVRGQPGASLSDPRLVKPHGTVRDPTSFRFLASQVSRSLDTALVDLMARQALGKDLFIIGYAGMDPDLSPILRSAIAASNAATWWDFPTMCTAIAARYASFVGTKLTLQPSSFPGLDFVAEIERRYSTVRTGSAPRRLLALDPGPPNVDVTSYRLSRYHYAAAKILELSGSHSFRRRFVRGLGSGSVQQRTLSAGALIAADLYSERRRVVRRSIQLAAAGLDLVDRVPGRSAFERRVPARIGHLRLLEREGLLEETLRVARSLEARHSGDARFLLDLAAAERKAGSAGRAQAVAEAALASVDKSGDLGVVVCRALFEVAEASRIVGDLVKTSAALFRLKEVAGVFGGPRWARWADYEHAALKLIEGQADAARSIFHEGARWFLQRGARVAATTHLLAESGAARVSGDLWGAASSLGDAEQLCARLGPRHPALKDWASLEKAELERAAGRPTLALYDVASSSELITVALLAQLGHAIGTPQVRDVELSCQAHNFWFGAEAARELRTPGISSAKYFGTAGWTASAQIAFP